MIEILNHGGVSAVCFECGAEKDHMFAVCSACDNRPTSKDEFRDSLLLSRYMSTNELLERAIAQRSPGVVIKAADKATLKEASKALREPQLAILLGIPLEKEKASNVLGGRASARLGAVLKAAEDELGPNRAAKLSDTFEGGAGLTALANTERVVLALDAESEDCDSIELAQAVGLIAERCEQVDQACLAQASLDKDGAGQPSAAELTELHADYQQSVMERTVSALNKARTETISEVLARLEKAVDNRVDRRMLPVVAGVFSTYKQFVINPLRTEMNNAKQLIQAIRNTPSTEWPVLNSLVDALEELLLQWRRLAKPLMGVAVDADIKELSRVLNLDLQAATDYVTDISEDMTLASKLSRLTLGVM